MEQLKIILNFFYRCPIVEEEDAATPLNGSGPKLDSTNGGCMGANIPNKEVSRLLDKIERQSKAWPYTLNLRGFALTDQFVLWASMVGHRLFV